MEESKLPKTEDGWKKLGFQISQKLPFSHEVFLAGIEYKQFEIVVRISPENWREQYSQIMSIGREYGLVEYENLSVVTMEGKFISHEPFIKIEIQ